MASPPTDSGDLSHNSSDPEGASAHRTAVTPKATPATVSSVSGAARNGRQFYQMLSVSSIGLELGLSVVFGVLFGRWLDGKLGTAPWMMVLFLGFGLVA